MLLFDVLGESLSTEHLEVLNDLQSVSKVEFFFISHWAICLFVSEFYALVADGVYID